MKRKDGSAYTGAKGTSGSNVPSWLSDQRIAVRERERRRRARIQGTNQQRMEWLEDAAFKGKQMGIFPTNAKDAWNSVVATNAPRPPRTVAPSTVDAIKRRAKNINSKIGKP